MKYVVIMAAITGMVAGCQSQKTVAVSEPKYIPLSEVQSVSMDAQNYNNRRFTTDTIHFDRMPVDSLKN